ncbi:MAG: hypothetical protein KJZ83_05830 [Burkholderiaceae bacterium]|nr:hypothetical protein [Burkholderiaceae bacterium]
MSLAFDLQTGPTPRLRKAVLGLYLFAAGSAAASIVLVYRSLQSPATTALAASALAAFALLAGLAWSFVRSLRRGDRGTLSVGPDGAATWKSASGTGESDVNAVRWCSVAGLAWIEARSGSRRLLLLSGRDRCGDRDWAQLARWLRWLERGRES